MADNKYRREKSLSGNGFTSIDWDCIFRDVLRSWWVIIAGALTAALLAGAFILIRYSTRYTCQTTFVIGRSGFSYEQVYDNLEQAETTTTQYSQILGSSLLKNRVMEELGLSSYPADVSVRTVESTNLMIMTVTADSPRTAFLISRSVRKQTLELMGAFINGVTIKELDPASIPSKPVNPLVIAPTMEKAAILGAALMVLLLALISHFKDTIKNPEDVPRKIDTRLLGIIYYEKPVRTLKSRLKKHHRKASLLLGNPMLSFGYVEAYRMLAARLQISLDTHKDKVLMVTSVTENEGKSTVSVNLAKAFSQQGKSVLLMDCDFRNPSLAKLLDITLEEEQDLTVMMRERKAGKLGHLEGEKNLYTLLSASPQPSSWTRESMRFLRELINSAKERVDYVIIDMSPMAFVSDAEEYASLTDASLLVIRQDVMEAAYINDAVDALENAGSRLTGCVLNGVRRGIVNRVRQYGHYNASGYGHYSHYRRSSQQTGEETDG